MRGTVIENLRGKSLAAKIENVSHKECQKICDETEGCKSLRYCPRSRHCFIKDQQLDGNEDTEKKERSDEHQCFSSFKSCEPGNRLRSKCSIICKNDSIRCKRNHISSS